VGKLPFFRHPYSGCLAKVIGDEDTGNVEDVVEDADTGNVEDVVEDVVKGNVEVPLAGGRKKSIGKSTATSVANLSMPISLNDSSV
jgi:hypothetical protein